MSSDDARSTVEDARAIRIVFYGSQGVGKKTFVRSFATSMYHTSDGVGIGSAAVHVNGVRRIVIASTFHNRQRANHTIRSTQPTDAVVFVFDPSRRDTFEVVTPLERSSRFIDHAASVTVLLANQTHVRAERRVDRSEARAFAASSGMAFRECSTTDSAGVRRMFFDVVAELHRRRPYMPASGLITHLVERPFTLSRDPRGLDSAALFEFATSVVRELARTDSCVCALRLASRAMRHAVDVTTRRRCPLIHVRYDTEQPTLQWWSQPSRKRTALDATRRVRRAVTRTRALIRGRWADRR